MNTQKVSSYRKAIAFGVHWLSITSLITSAVKTLQRIVLSTAITLTMTLCLAPLIPVAVAQSQDGSIAGHTSPGAEVTVTGEQTGFSRTVTAGDDGSYRFPYLPVGRYTLQASKGGGTISPEIPVTVNLGTTSVVNAFAGQDVIRVVGSRGVGAIDVTSSELATNVGRVELARLPVERSLQAVAQLAPGVFNSSEFDAISFGGASVSENAVYINGLNVTDIFNKVGFSSVPYAFYDEFQVKTGGYSVKFGRTTGGVINTVTRSGTNEFEYGAQAVWEPSFLQAEGDNHFDTQGNPQYIAQYNEFDRRKLNFYAGGPIVRDKLFFFAMYEMRQHEPVSTDSLGGEIYNEVSDDDFWGAKVDWQINDSNLLELLVFSDENTLVRRQYAFDYPTGTRGDYRNTLFLERGGLNWSTTYTAYLTDTLTVRAMYGRTERAGSDYTPNDVDCAYIFDTRENAPGGAGFTGCGTNFSVDSRTGITEQARLDFEWAFGDHRIRFGGDYVVKTSEYLKHNTGPDGSAYRINDTVPGAILQNGGVVPAGASAYVRVDTGSQTGNFETTATSLYLEDSWQVTDTLVVDVGLRWDAFDNKAFDGESFLKLDDMLAPRLGFAWDISGEGRSKLFASAGRYFLPVANVVNIKQASSRIDIRDYYVFEGLEAFEYNGQTYHRPILGARIGASDHSQGNPNPNLAQNVDADPDPVYQDEIILGYQSMIDESWSWGVRAIYRDLTNAIDDMEIPSNGMLCPNGDTGYVGWVEANPSNPVTVFTDTNCDGVSDAFVTIDTSQAGWPLYDDAGNYIGERGWPEPERTYKALEFVVDRAWDDVWAFNASYTLSYSEGNYEGPINSDTGFGASGWTENFDTPFVNIGWGPLPNDRRHQIKLRGSYAFNEHWRLGGLFSARSGRPLSPLGVGNPYSSVQWISHFVCVADCNAPIRSQQQWELKPRGAGGRLPWVFNLNLGLTYLRSFGDADLRAKIAVYNVLDDQGVTEVQEFLQPDVGFRNPDYGLGSNYQRPRYVQFVVTVNF